MAKRNNGTQEDARRRRISSTGRVEIICTLCEDEGRPYVQAKYEYAVVSTMTETGRRITACSNHADQLDEGKLPYEVVGKRKGPKGK